MRAPTCACANVVVTIRNINIHTRALAHAQEFARVMTAKPTPYSKFERGLKVIGRYDDDGEA